MEAQENIKKRKSREELNALAKEVVDVIFTVHKIMGRDCGSQCMNCA